MQVLDSTTQCSGIVLGDSRWCDVYEWTKTLERLCRKNCVHTHAVSPSNSLEKNVAVSLTGKKHWLTSKYILKKSKQFGICWCIPIASPLTMLQTCNHVSANISTLSRSSSLPQPSCSKTTCFNGRVADGFSTSLEKQLTFTFEIYFPSHWKSQPALKNNRYRVISLIHTVLTFKHIGKLCGCHSTAT